MTSESWREGLPGGIADPRDPRGNPIETSTDRRWLWHLECLLAVTPSPDSARTAADQLRRYLTETCEHHWMSYGATPDLPSHQQCLWCHVVEWDDEQTEIQGGEPA